MTVHFNSVGLLTPSGTGKSDPSAIFNVKIPEDIRNKVLDSVGFVSNADIQKAHEASIWKGFRLIQEDIRLTTVDHDAFLQALPYLGSKWLEYVSDTWQWECRSFASLFVCLSDAILHLGAVAKTLDFQGHHSYNLAVLRKDGELKMIGVEPQLDKVIEELDPSSHYTGTGIAVLGG